MAYARQTGNFSQKKVILATLQKDGGQAKSHETLCKQGKREKWVKGKKIFLGFKNKKKNNKIFHFPSFPLFPLLHFFLVL